MAKFVFRSLAREHPEPSDFLAHANEVVVGEIAVGKFITMAYVRSTRRARCSARAPGTRSRGSSFRTARVEALALRRPRARHRRAADVRRRCGAELPAGRRGRPLHRRRDRGAARTRELFGVERLDALLAAHAARARAGDRGRRRRRLPRVRRRRSRRRLRDRRRSSKHVNLRAARRAAARRRAPRRGSGRAREHARGARRPRSTPGARPGRVRRRARPAARPLAARACRRTAVTLDERSTFLAGARDRRPPRPEAARVRARTSSTAVGATASTSARSSRRPTARSSRRLAALAPELPRAIGYPRDRSASSRVRWPARR